MTLTLLSPTNDYIIYKWTSQYSDFIYFIHFSLKLVSVPINILIMNKESMIYSWQSLVWISFTMKLIWRVLIVLLKSINCLYYKILILSYINYSTKRFKLKVLINCLIEGINFFIHSLCVACDYYTSARVNMLKWLLYFPF